MNTGGGGEKTTSDDSPEASLVKKRRIKAPIWGECSPAPGVAGACSLPEGKKNILLRSSERRGQSHLDRNQEKKFAYIGKVLPRRGCDPRKTASLRGTYPKSRGEDPTGEMAITQHTRVIPFPGKPSPQCDSNCKQSP